MGLEERGSSRSTVSSSRQREERVSRTLPGLTEFQVLDAATVCERERGSKVLSSRHCHRECQMTVTHALHVLEVPFRSPEPQATGYV